MRRYLPLAALGLAAILGALAIGLPGRGTVAPPAPPPRAAAPPRATPEPPAFPAAPPRPHTVGPAANRAEPAGASTASRTGPFPANPAGISAAIAARRGEILPCWQDWRRANPDGPTQPVLAIALTASGVAEARLSGADGGAFDACVRRSLADAAFQAPDVALLTLLVPVPMPAAE